MQMNGKQQNPAQIRLQIIADGIDDDIIKRIKTRKRVNGEKTYRDNLKRHVPAFNHINPLPALMILKFILIICVIFLYTASVAK